MKLFIGNLSFQVDDDSLKSLFEQHGTVTSARVITDRETGRSRGFGFVEMGSEDEGNAAMEALDNAALEGRNIAVKPAIERSRA